MHGRCPRRVIIESDDRLTIARGKHHVFAITHHSSPPSHAQITIPRGAEAQARAFYCDLLGLPEIEKPDSLKGRGGFWVMVGDQQVHVGVEDGVDRSRTKAHLAYQVDDLAGWHARLLAHGVEIGDSVPIPGYERFEFRDPFGNRVEFISPLDEVTNADKTMDERSP